MINLPLGWHYIRVGDLCQAFNGRAFKSTEWAKSGLPIIRIQNLKNHNALYNYYEGNFEQRYFIKKNDLLFAWSGTPGTSFGAHIWNGPDALLNQHIFKLVFDESIIDKKYLRLALNENVTKYIEQAQGGVGLAHITKSKFDNSTIPLPPLNEQKRIVAIIEELFSELDNGLESLKRTQEILKAYRQTLLKNAFEGKLTEQWRNQNKGRLKSVEELTSFIQQERKKCYEHVVEKWKFDSKFGRKSLKPRQPKNLDVIAESELKDLPILPDTWIWDKLGWMTLGVEYGTSAKSAEKGAVAVLRMGNIQNGVFTWDDLVFTSDKDEIEKYFLNHGDVLFNRTNSPEHVGKTALYRGEFQAIFAGYLIRINQINSIVNGQYLSLYLNSPLAKQLGNRVKTDGVNQSNINGEKLINYPFPYCSLEEQEIIVSILEKYFFSIDSLERDIQSNLFKLNTMRQSILKKAFSGELTHQDSKDEPAIELMEKIQKELTIQNNPKRTSKKQKVVT